MKKKIAAFAMAAMLTMTTAMGVSASNDEFTYTEPHPVIFGVQNTSCLLYTSDAADE